MTKIKTVEEVGVKISSTQENLAHGLSVVSRISSKNVNLPILQNVLIKADEKVLRLSATNLEMAVSCLVRSKVEKTGEFTVPARLLADYVSLLPREKIDLEAQGVNLTVKSGKSETSLAGIPANEFPVIPQVQNGATFVVQIETLKAALGSVLFAAAQHESRPELSGVFFGFNHASRGEGTLTIAATDSYRLGETVIALGGNSSPTATSAIIPSRTVAELIRILSLGGTELSTPTELTICLTENQVQFATPEIELVSRLVMGQYPEYHQIIPAQFRTEAVLPREEFTKAVRAASLFSKAGLYDVKLEFAGKRPLKIHAHDAQTGEFHTEVSGEVSGPENAVVVNYKYLLDGLSAIRDEEVVFKMIDGANPCLLAPKSNEERYLYIVMPIKQ